jgi:hypothetical protein
MERRTDLRVKLTVTPSGTIKSQTIFATKTGNVVSLQGIDAGSGLVVAGGNNQGLSVSLDRQIGQKQTQ